MAEEPREGKGRRLEQVKLFFDANKHLSTLSVAALVFVFAAERAGLAINAGVGLVIFGGCLLLTFPSLVLCIFLTGVGEDEEMEREGIYHLLYWFLGSSLIAFHLGILLVIFLPAITL